MGQNQFSELRVTLKLDETVTVKRGSHLAQIWLIGFFIGNNSKHKRPEMLKWKTISVFLAEMLDGTKKLKNKLRDEI